LSLLPSKQEPNCVSRNSMPCAEAVHQFLHRGVHLHLETPL
jgi:hypothetical protein